MSNRLWDQNIYTGTSGLVVPITKDLYPPEYQGKSRLDYYASLFNSIEINSSFYKMPQAATIKKWSEGVPDHFRFTFKILRSVTHNKGLDYDPAEVGKFMNVISHTGNKKGCLLIQFPPGLHNQIHRLRCLLSDIHAADNRWQIAVEFRHVSWYHDSVFRLMEEFNASMVVHDLPKSSPPFDEYTSETVYLRFHGPGGRYRGSYTEDFLREYAEYIREWQLENKIIYAYFNNTMGDALKNLQTLNGFLG